jgi:hypothetical protein
VLIVLLGSIAFAVAVSWVIATVFLKGEDLSAFDFPAGERLSTGREPSAELKAVVASLSGIREALRGVPLRGRIAALLKRDRTNPVADQTRPLVHPP